jgi:hypothetical protein
MNSKIILFTHTIFLVIFFILLRYNDNLDELIFSDLFYVFLIIIPIIVGFTILLKILIKNQIKSTLLSSFILGLFFIYQPIWSALHGFQIANIEIGRNIILLPIIGIISIIIIYKFMKSKKDFRKILTISYGIILILIIFNVTEIVYYSTFNDSNIDEQLIKKFSKELSEFRDVYYIILDEHSSTEALEKYMNYDNSDFDKSLESMGFFIPEKSFSNYIDTRHSIPATLNMNYIEFDSELSVKEKENKLTKMVQNNAVTKIFENNGYNVIQFYNEFNMKIKTNTNIELCNENIGKSQFLSFVLDNTPLIFVEKFTNQEYDEYKKNRLCIFNEMPILDEKYIQPIFVYAHILLPHTPYLFTYNGSSTSYDNKMEVNSERYISQLQFTDKKILELVKKLLEKETPPIIVIQSDHGYRVGTNNYAEIDQSFSNFSAFYFPEAVIEDSENSFTNVNSFRILFNTNFGTNYEIIENKLFSIKFATPEDITDILTSENTVN